MRSEDLEKFVSKINGTVRDGEVRRITLDKDMKDTSKVEDVCKICRILLSKMMKERRTMGGHNELQQPHWKE